MLAGCALTPPLPPAAAPPTTSEAAASPATGAQAEPVLPRVEPWLREVETVMMAKATESAGETWVESVDIGGW